MIEHNSDKILPFKVEESTGHKPITHEPEGKIIPFEESQPEVSDQEYYQGMLKESIEGEEGRANLKIADIAGIRDADFSARPEDTRQYYRSIAGLEVRDGLIVFLRQHPTVVSADGSFNIFTLIRHLEYHQETPEELQLLQTNAPLAAETKRLAQVAVDMINRHPW